MDSNNIEGNNPTSLDMCEVDTPITGNVPETTQVEKLKDEIKALEQLVGELEATNQQQKDQINRLQKERIRKSVIIEKPIDIESLQKSEDNNPDEKLEQFFKMFHTNSLSNAQITLHSVNTLVCAHQLLYTGDNINDSKSTIAEKIAFNYMLEFMRQINEKKLNLNENIEFSYPITWLLSLFPYNNSNDKQQNEITNMTTWLPLHFALAIDTSTSSYNTSNYLHDLKILLEEYGSFAFDEEVSPLSIAVSLSNPNIEAVRLILDYRPDSVSKKDEDGSLPFMHACANNGNIETIQYLYEIYPDAINMIDSYSCAAIHYAAYYGTPCVVQYLLELSPQCIQLKEGNGALPLHDAVQNQRNPLQTEEMVSILLQHCPIAAKQRDDLGAFPLHKAAKSATMDVVQLLYKEFPKAVFGADSEGLLPVHYVAERADKDQHLDLLQFIVEANPQSKVLDDAALFAVEGNAGSGAAAGWRGAMFSMWGSGAKSNTTTTSGASTTAAASTTLNSTNTNNPLTTSTNTSNTSSKVVHNRRRSVRPVSASIHQR